MEKQFTIAQPIPNYDSRNPECGWMCRVSLNNETFAISYGPSESEALSRASEIANAQRMKEALERAEKYFHSAYDDMGIESNRTESEEYQILCEIDEALKTNQ